jgi:serine/threonine protein kinase
LSKECKSFLKGCLQKNPNDRLTAKQLLEHNFFKVNLSTDDGSMNSDKLTSTDNLLYIPKTENSYNVTGSQGLTAININTGIKESHTAGIMIPPSSPKKANNLQSYSILKNVQNFHVIGQPKKEEKIVNILADNPTEGAFFSISMTVYSQQSLLPHMETICNKDNRIIPVDILEVDEPETSPKVPELSGKKTNKLQFIFNGDHQLDMNSLNDDSVLNHFLESYNIKDLNDFQTFEKLNTLEIKKEDLEMLEKIFKEKRAT